MKAADVSLAEGRVGTAHQRDDSALARCDLFLVSAVATVLVTRTLLAVTGYPQIGGNGLHIAHVLWGGLLMALAILVVEIAPGTRARVRAAFFGGIGFGLFIDEVGKFVSKDVDYFFKPAIAIIYATVVALYVLVRLLLRRRLLTDQRRVALAAQAVADQAIGQLDEFGRRRAEQLLADVEADGCQAQNARSLRDILNAGDLAPPGIERRISNVLSRLQLWLERRLTSQTMRRVVFGVFAFLALSTLAEVSYALIRGGDGKPHAVLSTALPGLVSGVLIVLGVAAIFTSRRVQGWELLEAAIIINLLFTQVAVFYRDQWLGLVGFALWLLALGVVRAARVMAHSDRGDTTADPYSH